MNEEALKAARGDIKRLAKQLGEIDRNLADLMQVRERAQREFLDAEQRLRELKKPGIAERARASELESLQQALAAALA